jgi:peptidoglycan/LPS O-acetylase OafA/YrhL
LPPKARSENHNEELHVSTNLLLESPASPEPQPIVTTAAAPAPRRAPRYESLDMWRGLCCLSLVVFHSTMQVARHHFVDNGGTVTDFSSLLLWITARAWVGVPIFFVISGYCIMATLSARQKKGGVTEFA